MATPPAAALTLPRLGHLPPALFLHEAGDSLRGFAAALAHAGVLRDHHLDQPLPEAIDTALAEWLRPRAATLGVFAGVELHYGPDWTDLSTGGDCGDDHGAPRHESAGLFLRTIDQNRPIFLLGRRLKALEKKHPGAGAALIQLIEHGSLAGLGLFTPAAAIETAQHHYWRGEETAEKFIETMIEEDPEAFEGEDPKDATLLCAQWDVPTTPQVFGRLPEWVWKGDSAHRTEAPDLPPLTGAFRALGTAAAALSAHLRTVHARWRTPLTADFRRGADYRTPNDLSRLRPLGNTTLHTPVILRWEDDDIGPRVFDDAYNDEFNNGSETDLATCGAVIFDPLDPPACRAAFDRLHDLLLTATLTSRLLLLAAIPET